MKVKGPSRREGGSEEGTRTSRWAETTQIEAHQGPRYLFPGPSRSGGSRKSSLCHLWWLHDLCLFQLLEQIHKVNFLLHEDVVTFNDNGDPLSSYDIIAWDWSGPKWTFQVIGSSRWSPVRLDINKTKIQWHGKDNQVMGMWLLTR